MRTECLALSITEGNNMQTHVAAEAACGGSPSVVRFSFDVADLASKPFSRRRGLLRPPQGLSVTDQIMALLTHRRVAIMRPEALEPGTLLSARARVEEAVRLELPIPLVIIAWPFKVVWKTTRRLPDLGELVMIRRMRWIAESIERIYSPGVRWTVFIEGDLYKPLIGAPPGYVEAYRKGVHELIRLSGMQGRIECFSLREALFGDSSFEARRDEALRVLRADVVQRGLERVVGSSFLRVIWSSAVLGGDLDPPGDFPQIHAINGASRRWTEVQRIVLEYLAINEAKHRLWDDRGFLACEHDATLAARHLDETGLYLSFTGKPERLGICAVLQGSRTLPHHGVPVVLPDGQFQITPLRRSQGLGCTPVYCDGDLEDEPFFYVRPGVSPDCVRL